MCVFCCNVCYLPGNIHSYRITTWLIILPVNSHDSIRFRRVSYPFVLSIYGYTDADWAGDIDDSKFTSGYVFRIGNAAVSWRSKKQTNVALSTAEAEYMALSSAAQEAIGMRQLLFDLKNKPTKPTVLFEDNQSCICIAKNPQFHGRTKHIRIKYHFVRDQVKENNIEIKYCNTEDIVADMLTKGLNVEKFINFRNMLGLSDMKCGNQPSSEKE